jgi:ABC-type dipeptide/oligopeptide/nickel transport system permease component
VRAYIIRRLLLMIPTLFGVTLVTFLVMQLAPGDPLLMALGQGGSQGTSQNTREAYLVQRRQWKLDKPAVINIRWFQDYSEECTQCARIRSLTDEEIKSELDRLASKPEEKTPLLRFLLGLGIDSFLARLKEENLRPDLAKVVATAVQIRMENLADHAVVPLVGLLKKPGDLRLKIGAIRCLALTTLGDPFTYTYSKEPQEDETEAIQSTWSIWWSRAKAQFKPLPPDRQAQVESLLRALVAEPSRSRILEGMDPFVREDVPYLMGRLEGSSTLKEKYVATLILKSVVGRPLRIDVKQNDSESAVAQVSGNWIAYADTHSARFRPPFLAKLWYIVADTQYANSLVKLVTFSFGRSMVKPYDPVGPKILEAAFVSAPIMILAEALVYLLAVPLGVICSVTRGRAPDRSITFSLFILYSIPSFVAGMLALTFLCYGQFLKIFPMYNIHSEGSETFSLFARALDYLWHIALPVICLSIFSLAAMAMYARSSMLDIVNQDYVRTARAKGLAPSSVILKHSLRNALIPVITLFSNFLPALLGGSVLIEVLFGIPGMGRLSFDSIQAKDYNTLMALTYVEAIVVMASILISDLLYVVVDPRITFDKAGGAA